MANLDTLDRNDLLKELFDLAREQGVADKEAWDDLADEVIDSHVSLAELDPDQDLLGVQTLLKMAWDEYRRTSGQESPRAIDEDPEAPNA